MILIVIQTKYALSFFLVNLDDGSFLYHQTPLLKPCSSFFKIIFNELNKKWQINSACDKKNFYLICDKEKAISLKSFFKEENIYDIRDLCLLTDCKTLACFEDAVFDGEKFHHPLWNIKDIEFFEQNTSDEIDNYFSNKVIFGGILPTNLRDVDKEQALLSFYASSIKLESSIKSGPQDLIITGYQFNLLPLLELKIESLLWSIKQGLFRILLDEKMLLLIDAFLRQKSFPEESFSGQLKFLPACYVLVFSNDLVLSFDFALKKKNEIKLEKNEVFLIPGKGKVGIVGGGEKIELEQEKTSLGLVVDTREKDLKRIQSLPNKKELKGKWHKAFEGEGKF